jgi:hypothetical protein
MLKIKMNNTSRQHRLTNNAGFRRYAGAAALPADIDTHSTPSLLLAASVRAQGANNW